MRSFRRLVGVSGLLFALGSCSGSPALCNGCPDVAGAYSLTRTLSGQIQCPGAPLPGAVRALVTQNGSRLTYEIEGAVLKGYLYEDLSCSAAGKRSRDGTETSVELSGSFLEDSAQPGGLLLRADVIETTTQGNPGRSCQVRAFLEGAR
ncbi:MAG TPA: hypothetical protein VGK67_18455 [Myxococcales bacterium]|jgi:hypothetical protein